MFFSKNSVQSLLGLKGFFGGIAADVVMSVTGIRKANMIFKPLEGLKGMEFAQESLNVLDITAEVSQEDLQNIPQSGPCIICSNHPFGCIDGLMMLAAVGRVRKDVRIMTNFILSAVPCLAESFISVDPFAVGKPKSVRGVMASLEHLENGGCLVLFPAGEVSSNRNPQRVVKDIEWQAGAMRIISKARVPVIPAFFSGCNSWFFHALGAVHPILRTIRLPREMLNKRGQTISLKYGKAVKPAELASFQTSEELASYLRNRTYALEGLLYGDEHPVVLKNSQEIELHIDPSILRAELATQEKNVLYRECGYTCYLSRYDEIPYMMHEIGVCREETFRKNNEGTGKPIDIDEYDKYYHHMFLWNEDSGELVGAYRVGAGRDIMSEYGIKGFYSDLFFHFKDGIVPLLEESIELGRSFIVEKYQGVPNMLKLLLNNGLSMVMKRFPDMHYFFGAASISSAYPPMFGSLIVEYLKRTRMNEKYKDMVVPDVPFVPVYNNLDINAIPFEDLSVDQFDKTLVRFSSGKFRLPPLIRAYSKFNGSYIGFNVDPDFNYCIDALVLTAFDEIPAEQMV